jgi:hypothetical protein
MLKGLPERSKKIPRREFFLLHILLSAKPTLHMESSNNEQKTAALLAKRLPF